MKQIENKIIMDIVYDYTVNYIGSPTLSEKYGIPKRQILKILKDSGCSVGKSGRKYKGGKWAADKRYYEKNKSVRQEKINRREIAIDSRFSGYEKLYSGDSNKPTQHTSHQYIIRKTKEIIEMDNIPFDTSKVRLDKVIFKVIDRKTSEPIIKEYEWLGYLPKYCNHYFGLYFVVDDCEYLGGVVALQPEYGENLGVWDKYGYRGKIIQLSRGVCLWWTPKNSASYMISRVVKWLKNNTRYCIITATTDSNAGEIGTIYQSLNWVYIGVFGGNLTPTGKERIRYGYIINGKIYNQRHIRSKIGTAKKEKVLKHFPDVEIVNLGRKRRYFYFFGAKKENKENLSKIKHLVRNYPKR
jgi:hypothetical protein